MERDDLGLGLACMIDVELVTLGIIRCNIGDSVKCKIAFEHGDGNGDVSDSSCALCFVTSVFLLWISDQKRKKKNSICVRQLILVFKKASQDKRIPCRLSCFN